MMLPDAIKAIANAILYEGYMLYPYRPSALKNQRPGWSFGTLLPPAYVERIPGDSSYMEGQMLLTGANAAELTIEVRFLQLTEPAGSAALERSVLMKVPGEQLLQGKQEKRFAFEDGAQAIAGQIELTATLLDPSALKLALRVSNCTPLREPLSSRDAALRSSLIAAHAILTTSEGEFVSLLDPPDALRTEAVACRQTGVFPVLIGDERNGLNMLLSPIILSDYPQIAPESPGDFFDSSEIDELLTLRLLTLTDSEKDELRQAGKTTHDLLDRTHSCRPEDLLRMHGVIRERMPQKEQP
jgi:hydrogenase maturation protease